MASSRTTVLGADLPGASGARPRSGRPLPDLNDIRARLATPLPSTAPKPEFLPGPGARLLGPRTDLLVAGLLPTPSNFEAAKPAGLNPLAARESLTPPDRGPSTLAVPFRPSAGVFVADTSVSAADVAKEAFGRIAGT